MSHPFWLQLLIDGKFVDSRSGKVFGTEDPRTGKKLTDVAEAQKEDVDAAVQAARKVSIDSLVFTLCLLTS